MADYELAHLLDPFVIVASALSIIAALAWNNAIQATIDKYHADDNSLKARWVYAGIITVVVIAVAFWLIWLRGKVKVLY